MSDKPSPEDGQEGNMLPSNEAVAQVLARNFAPQESIVHIVWLLDHGRARGLSQAQLAKFVGLDGGTLSKVLNGNYPTGLDGIVARIVAVRTEQAARLTQAEKPIVDTWLLKEIGKFCEGVRADESMGILIGRSHSGKTTALESYTGTHANVVFVRMPAGGAARIFLQDLAEASGASVRGAYDALRRSILKRFRSGDGDRPQLLIIDEVHETVSGRRVQTVTLTLIRELHDLTGCPVVLCATPQFIDRMRDERVARYFEQLDNRAPFQRHLPDLPPMCDINAILAAYGLPPAPEQKLHKDDDQTPAEVVQDIRSRHGLGKLVKLVRKARRVARNRQEKLAWSHVLDTVATNASHAQGDGPVEPQDGEEDR